MSQNSNTKNLSLFIWILALVVCIKLIWVVVSYIYLPEQGVSVESGKVKSTLHYRYRLASDVAAPKVPTSIARPTQKAPSIKDIQLVGIYSSKDGCIVTLLKKGKSHILSNGDDIDGFVLKRASAREAYFERDGKEYTLKLFEEKKSSSSVGTIEPVYQGRSESPEEVDTEISSRDGIKLVPRSLLKSYVSDISKAMRDIGLRPVRRSGQMLGYKVRFIRKGTPLAKLGLQRGDVIKAINGEDIVDFNGPMGILKTADTIEGLTITVIRKNEEKELEYEVK